MDTESSRDTATTDTGPGTETSADDIGRVPPPQTANRRNGWTWLSVGLVCAASLLRSRRFQGQVIIGVIGVAAVAALARENQARIVARLVAWDKQQELRHQRGAKRR